MRTVGTSHTEGVSRSTGEAMQLGVAEPHPMSSSVPWAQASGEEKAGLGPSCP